MRQALSAPRRGVLGFFRGLALPFRGAKLVYVEHLDLAKLWLVPIVLVALVLAGSLALAWREGPALAAAMWPDPGDDAEWWISGARDVLTLVVDVLLSIAALFTTLIVSGIVAAPFNARLAEVLDERLHGLRPPPFGLRMLARDLLRSLVIETVFFALNVVLAVLGFFVPAAGPVIGVLGAITWALYFAVGYVDAPQATRGRSLGDRARFLAAHPAAMLGFGTGVGLFLLVPIVNLLFMPAAVAGGVLFAAEADAEAATRSG